MAKKVAKITILIYTFSLFLIPVSQETNSKVLEDRIAEIDIELKIKDIEKEENSYVNLLEKRLLESDDNKGEIKEELNIEKEIKSEAEEDLVVKEGAELNEYVFIGDSVMKMGEILLKEKFKNSYVDAKVSRQFIELPKILKDLSEKNKLGNKIIIHLGSNGLMNKEAFEKTMYILKDKEVYFMNCVVPKFWEESVNKNLREWSKEYKNVKIIDWYKYAKGQKKLFYKDATHLTKEGAKKYVDYIYSVVEEN